MKVSIIVPVFNSEKYLDDCLSTLVNQSLDSYEVIAIDDGSVDNSYAILKEFEQKYPDIIKVLSNEKNYGQSYTRNKGIKQAQGEYIAFVDSDDYVHPFMYQDMYEKAVKYDYPEVVIVGLTFVKGNEYLNKTNFSKDEGKIISILEHPEFVWMQSPSVCNKMFRRDTIQDKTFLEGRMWEDVGFSFACLFNANRALFLSNHYYFYRKRLDEGVSSKGFLVNAQLLDIFAVADEIEVQTKKTGRYSFIQEHVQFVQIFTCLQRVAEIMRWDISQEKKDRLCFDMYVLITQKYGDFRNFNFEELSVRVGYFALDYLNTLLLDTTNKIEQRDIAQDLEELGLNNFII